MDALYEVAAPAKLNLFLHVVGRRPDGYHLLQSLFVPIDWCDTLHFETRLDGRLVRHDLGDALPADDLSLRAARLLQAESGCRLGVDISVDKQIPWGAGLGGGSSDAASTLLALNRLWGLGWSRGRLAALALRLGADVPFFIGGRPAFVEGIGERLTSVERAAGWFAVVKPPESIATAAIFASPLLKRSDEAAILLGSARSALGSDAQLRIGSDTVHGEAVGEPVPWPHDVGYGRNDLQAAAEAQCTPVARAAALLQARYGNSRMTGSGSAVFASAGDGVQPVAQWPSLPAGWSGRMCRSLERHPLSGWAED